MLYGHTVNGPLQILRQLWTKKQEDPETWTTYQYVVDLQNKLQETWDLAHDELCWRQVRQRHYFDSRAKVRTFKKGDQESPGPVANQWEQASHALEGPFEVLRRMDGPDYLINMANKQKVFHANLLKPYFSAAPSEPSPNDSSDESPS